MALTNFHEKHNTLRLDENDWYNQYRNPLTSIGEEKKKNRYLTQEKYRSKRQMCLGLQFRGANSNADYFSGRRL